MEVRVYPFYPFALQSDVFSTRFHRSLTRPVFVRDRIADFDIFDRHTDQVLAVLKQRLREGHAVDFQVRIQISMKGSGSLTFL